LSSSDTDEKYIGTVIDICDGIVSVIGLRKAFSGELIRFQNSNGEISGFVWNLEDNVCKVPLINGTQSALRIGDSVFCTNKLVTTRCGFGVLGEIINPLGSFLTHSTLKYKEFALSKLFTTTWAAIDVKAPGIIKRAPVTIPFMTGIASVDSFIPIGCGQRELIIGDQNTGKTSLAITAIINQNYRNNVICSTWHDVTWCNYKYSLYFPCIYVAIGSKRSEIVRLRKVLETKEALHYTCIVFTSADDLAALQYLAPFAGCTIGEWFMKHGYNAVVVYDDLTQHAIAYRQLALLLRRPPGREAYPGDIFYLHARLLERSAQLVHGGSLTALPIIQTLGGDLSGYISTNVISITDGQIFLVKSLINKGIRPAVDLSLSVSRVGSAAQYGPMAFVSKKVKSVFSLYKFFSGIAKIGSEDPEVMLHVGRGERLLSFFTQALYETYSFYKQVVGLFALTIDATDGVLPNKVHMYFMLFSMKQFKYLKKIESRLVTFFLNVRLLEPLLMVFSFDLIKRDITLFINHFSSFFKAEVQHKSTCESMYLLQELFFRNTKFKISDLW